VLRVRGIDADFHDLGQVCNQKNKKHRDSKPNAHFGIQNEMRVLFCTHTSFVKNISVEHAQILMA
jgi:hypothetical protein